MYFYRKTSIDMKTIKGSFKLLKCIEVLHDIYNVSYKKP